MKAVNGVPGPKPVTISEFWPHFIIPVWWDDSKNVWMDSVVWKTKKLQGFRIFSKSGFLNFAIIKSFSHSKTNNLIKEVLLNKMFSPFQNLSMAEIWLWLSNCYYENLLFWNLYQQRTFLKCCDQKCYCCLIYSKYNIFHDKSKKEHPICSSSPIYLKFAIELFFIQKNLKGGYTPS